MQGSFIFHCVDEKWQHESCGLLKTKFVCCDKIYKGSPCMPLTQPKTNKQTHPIGGDGNCMFRSMSYVMTGSQEHHLEVRAKTLEHMETIAPLTLGHIRGRSGAAMSKCSSLKKYIQYTNMDKQDTWGTEIELLVLSHLLKTSIYTYLTTDKKWFVHSPSKLDNKLAFDSTSKSVLQLVFCHHCMQLWTAVFISKLTGNPVLSPGQHTLWMTGAFCTHSNYRWGKHLRSVLSTS